MTTLAEAASMVVVASAASLAATPSRVTVTPTDTTPASGQTFRLYGAVRTAGDLVPATIRVRTFRQGAWVPLSGAVMHTNRDNRYRIRVVLQMKGERLLQVVGNPDEDGLPTARRTVTLTVHQRPAPSLPGSGPQCG